MCINGKIISVKLKNQEFYRKIQVDCNKCHICYNRRAISYAYKCWSYYNYNPDGSYFVTLTLSDEHLTDAPSKKDIQRFHKSLRKHYERNYPDNRFKFFLVSEYGYETERLHYHAIYMGLPYNYEKSYISISNELARIWKKGIVYVKPVDLSKIIYCIKYLHKDKELGNILMQSKDLGHLSDTYKRHMNTTNNYENLKVRLGNEMVNLPRYFRKKHMNDDAKENFCQYFVEKAEKNVQTGAFIKKFYNFEQSEKRFRSK